MWKMEELNLNLNFGHAGCGTADGADGEKRNCLEDV